MVAVLGAVVAVALMIWRNPDPDRVMDHGVPLAAAATGLALALFWFGPGKRPWFSGHRWRKGAAAAAILATGCAVGYWLRAILDSPGLSVVPAELAWASVQVTSFLMVLTGLFAVRRAGLRQGWWALRVRIGLAAGLAIAMVYLGRDEPVAPIVDRNAAVFSGGNQDEVTYRLTLRYTPESAGGRAPVVPTVKLRFPSDAAKRREYLVAHRAEIEADWAALSEVRAWWNEMAGHESLGDRSSWTVDQRFIRFAPVRAYQQTALAVAELQAMDGDRDGAIERVMGVYKVGAYLEESTCTLIRGMISVVVQKDALRSAEAVLDSGPVSATVRDRMAAMLAARPGDGSGIGRMMLCEAMYASSSIRAMGDGLQGPQINRWRDALWRCVGAGLRLFAFNPQATINRVHERMARAAELADARKPEELRAWEDRLRAEPGDGFRVKNIGGRIMVPLVFPAFSTIAKTYWEKEDRRAELLARLRD